MVATLVAMAMPASADPQCEITKKHARERSSASWQQGTTRPGQFPHLEQQRHCLRKAASLTLRHITKGVREGEFFVRLVGGGTVRCDLKRSKQEEPS